MSYLELRTWDPMWSDKSQLWCSQRLRLHRLTSSDLGFMAWSPVWTGPKCGSDIMEVGCIPEALFGSLSSLLYCVETWYRMLLLPSTIEEWSIDPQWLYKQKYPEILIPYQFKKCVIDRSQVSTRHPLTQIFIATIFRSSWLWKLHHNPLAHNL